MTLGDHLRAAPLRVIETNTDGEVIDANETATTTFDTTPKALRGTDIRDGFPKSAAGTLRAAFDGDSVTPRSFEDYYPRIDRWLTVDVRVGETVLVYVRDQTREKQDAEHVERLEWQFERVQEINGLIATVLWRVLDAPDRAAVGQTICERLGGTDLYRFVWFGERDFPGDSLRTLAVAGDAPELREGTRRQTRRRGESPRTDGARNGTDPGRRRDRRRRERPA